MNLNAELNLAIESDVPFTRLTTLAVGGPAHYLLICREPADLARGLEWARRHSVQTFILGGGSNLLVSDEGFDGLVLQLANNTIESEIDAGEGILRVGAGVVWDDLVAFAINNGLAGIECLSGIPGLVGAVPIQNVGAYGQEVSESVDTVWVMEQPTGEIYAFKNSECGFGYRHSHFKTVWKDRYVVTRVDIRLPRRINGTVRYPDLIRHFNISPGQAMPSLSAVRRAVIDIRQSKSMVINVSDPNHRSAGSFFINPIVPRHVADTIRTLSRAVDGSGSQMPEFSAADGQVKLSAAWLIERAGFQKGFILGQAGLSTRHTLALVNRGNARAADILTLASLIRRKVRSQFGVTLKPEIVFLGFRKTVDELLD